jgi:hypothetical protein
VSAPQAEAFASAVRDSHTSAELATKSDVRELKAEMRELELRMTIKLGIMLVGAISVIAALIKLL